MECDRGISRCQHLCEREFHIVLFLQPVAYVARFALLQRSAFVVAEWEKLATHWAGFIVGKRRDVQYWKHLCWSTGNVIESVYERHIDFRLGKPCNLDSGAGLLSEDDGRAARWERQRPKF